jgi:hypothetical protein
MKQQADAVLAIMSKDLLYRLVLLHACYISPEIHPEYHLPKQSFQAVADTIQNAKHRDP